MIRKCHNYNDQEVSTKCLEFDYKVSRKSNLSAWLQPYIWMFQEILLAHL